MCASVCACVCLLIEALVLHSWASGKRKLLGSSSVSKENAAH